MATWPAKTNYATGDVLSATNMNDIGNGLNDLYGESFTNNFYAGKNKIINGDFGIWQRGTTFTNATVNTYTADRWYFGGSGNNTGSISQQTFTPATAPVAGYEGTYFYRLNQTTTAISPSLSQRIEDVRTFAGQTITISFWAKTASSMNGLRSIVLEQNFGSGGSASVNTTVTGSVATTTSWTRFTYTIAVPSISGKTIGTGSYLALYLQPAEFVAITLDLWGVQVEAGSTATPFQTATGTKQGELAACQRYYQKSYQQSATVPTNSTLVGVQVAASGNVANSAIFDKITFEVLMRTAPTVTIYSFTSSTAAKVSDANGTDLAASSGVAGGIAERGCYVSNNSGGSITAASGGFIYHWAATAEL